jgi:hypothetical protein
MPKITETTAYNGAKERIERLGLSPLFDELQKIITSFSLLVKEERDSNGGAFVRKMIDEQFKNAGGWEKTTTGGVDWIKSRIVNGTRLCLGVEVQFSARSDLLIIDISHLRKALMEGRIDVGIIVVPSDRLGRFLTDRGPSFSDAKRHVQEARAEDFPLILIALEHDGSGPPLPKQAKRKSKGDLENI